jgi:hypothetical protein
MLAAVADQHPMRNLEQLVCDRCNHGGCAGRAMSFRSISREVPQGQTPPDKDHNPWGFFFGVAAW